MNNLFSIFDPLTLIFNLSMNWLSTILCLMIIPYPFWFIPSTSMYYLNFIFNKLDKEFKMLLNNNYIKGSTLFFLSFFYFILINNFMGMFPYIFTSTSHMVMTISLTLPLWISFMLYGWINNMQHMFVHLVPQGTPYILMPFMVLIETISNIIRPLTLAVRLTANMIAGHLLLTLLSKNGSLISFYLVSILLLIQIILLLLEFAVSIIQAYVFTVLSTLYSSELN